MFQLPMSFILFFRRRIESLYPVMKVAMANADNNLAAKDTPSVWLDWQGRDLIPPLQVCS